MTQFFSYWLWPNPADWSYGEQNVTILLVVTIGMVALSFAVRIWRKSIKNPMTRTLSRSWSAALLWFGLTGAFMVVSRVEQIQFLSMRALWAVWALILVLYAFFQFLQFQRRHYTVMRGQPGNQDARAKYLPRKKR